MRVFKLTSTAVQFPLHMHCPILNQKILSNTEVIYMPFNDETKISTKIRLWTTSSTFTQQHYHYQENNHCQQMYQETESQPPVNFHKFSMDQFYSWTTRSRPLPNYILSKLQELKVFSRGTFPVLTFFCKLANFNNIDMGHTP